MARNMASQVARRRLLQGAAGGAALGIGSDSDLNGYSDLNIAAVLGGNFRRLLGTIWA